MTAGVVFGRDLMLKLTSLMVYPLVFILLALSLYLIPEWNMSMLEVAPDWSAMPVIVGWRSHLSYSHLTIAQSSANLLKTNVSSLVIMQW